MELAEKIEQLFDNPPDEFTDEHRAVFEEFKQKLNAGEVRAAEKAGGRWRVNLWVKRGILVGFRMGRIHNYSINNQFRYYDKERPKATG
jgi:2,3,4,5-tetrahydropyridine-2-carboxylate N-succinyltransferase